MLWDVYKWLAYSNILLFRSQRKLHNVYRSSLWCKDYTLKVVLLFKNCLYSMQVGYTVWYVSLALFFSTMLVKNWRLYRIFHNSRNKNRVRIALIKLLIVIICKLMWLLLHFCFPKKYLSNWMLLLAIIIITSPVIIVIITKFTYRPSYVESFYTEDGCPDAVSFIT